MHSDPLRTSAAAAPLAECPPRNSDPGGPSRRSPEKVDLRFRHGFQHDTVVVRNGYVELDRRIGLTSNNGGPFAGIMRITASPHAHLLIEAESRRARISVDVDQIAPASSVTIDLDNGELHIATE